MRVGRIESRQGSVIEIHKLMSDRSRHFNSIRLGDAVENFNCILLVARSSLWTQKSARKAGAQREVNAAQVANREISGEISKTQRNRNPFTEADS